MKRKISYRYIIFASVILLIGVILIGFDTEVIRYLAIIEFIIGLLTGCWGAILIILSSNESGFKRGGGLAFAGALCAVFSHEVAVGNQVPDFTALLLMFLGGVINVFGILYKAYGRIF